MEDKQLNFDQPLISIRRHSPNVTPQKHENNVPNVTSQKHENRRINGHYHQLKPHVPGYRPELKSGPIRDPGTVPFLWEQFPGQPKQDTKPQKTQNSYKAPRLPPGKSKQQDSHNASQNTAGSSESKKQDLDVENIENSKDTDDEEGSDSGDSDEACVDALDAQACEFVMDRFLPVAKAMVSDTPHAPKKQPLKLHLQQPDKTAYKFKSSFCYERRYLYYQDNEEEESNDEYDRKTNLPSVCGLLPRFCLKSSLCFLSPVPAVSVRTRAPPSPSLSGSYSELENEQTRSDRSETKPTEKIPIAELHKIKLRSESGQSESHTLPFPEQKEALSIPIPKENRHIRIAGFELNSKILKTFQEFLDDREWDSEEGNAIETRTEHMHSVDSPHEDLKKLHIVDEDEHLQPNAENWGMDKPQDLNLGSTCKNYLVSTASSEKQLPKAVTWGNSKQINSELPAPPPLPKSPSDSWLWRTLPSMAMKHSSEHLFLGPSTNPENYCSKASTRDMKWETIVKNTKESLTTIPET